MAGPLSGIGQQQPQIVTAYQQGGQQNAGIGQARPEERQPTQNQVQPQGVQAAQTQTAETGNQNVTQQNLVSDALSGSLSVEQDSPRGSIRDISV